MAIEEPKYRLIEKSESFELRAYAPRIVAETLVSGSMDEAASAGFRVIADYIFGNNSSINGNSEKISMTAPVTMERQESEKISMTAPVTMEQKDGQWLVHFVMPAQYSLDSLPRPNNPKVRVREIPEMNYAVVRFSGFASEQKVARYSSALLSWLESKDIRPLGVPELARYDAPWTLPFLRRNEVMIAY